MKVAGIPSSAARLRAAAIALVAEVDPGDRRAEARPRQRVQPEVALEVEERPALDAPDLLALVVGDPDRPLAVAERLDVVESDPTWIFVQASQSSRLLRSASSTVRGVYGAPTRARRTKRARAPSGGCLGAGDGRMASLADLTASDLDAPSGSVVS